MKAVLYIAVFSTLISNSFAKSVHYPMISMNKISDSTIVFEKCYSKNACNIIGNEKGYSIDDLNFSPKLKKSKAVLIGTGELVVGAVGGWIAGWAAWGAGASASLMWGTTVGTGAVVTATPSVIDKFNPVLTWKMADVEAKIHKDKLNNDDKVVIEFDDEIQMAKFTKTLNKVLADIK